MTPCALTFLLILYPFPGCLMAGPGPLPPSAAEASVAAYGRTNPHCAEWTDGCVVCQGAGEHPSCSTPGIACTPASLRCTRPETP